MAGQIIKTNLEACFKQILNGEPVEVDIDNANDLLNSLNINRNGLHSKIKTVLPFLLIHFIRSWPGWQKSGAYFDKKISFEDWFKKFKEYLSFKLNFLIKNEIQKVCEEVEQLTFDSSYLFGIDNSTQTENVEQSEAPYSIEIIGPPRFLNTMVFAESFNNDIVLKEYNTHVEWSDKLTMRQLINWPHIEIEFMTKDLQFKRSNLHEFQRFLGCDNYKLPEKPSNECCIVEMDIIDITLTRKSYTLNVIKEYCNMYISVLKKQQKLLNLSDNNLKSIEIILEDLILDLMDINKNSIATNTSVLFNIGHCTYARNKSKKKGSEAVRLTEFVTPNTLLSFISFTAFAESDSDPFPSLKEMENEEKDFSDMVPKISYKCTFCVKNFSDEEEIWKHLKSKHAMELHVQCFRCKQQFPILTLTEHRWRHLCLSQDNSNSPKSSGAS